MGTKGIDYLGNEGSELRAQLEALLDRYSSPELLIEALAIIASEKADHVLAHWGDEGRALLWEKIARSLDREVVRLLKYGNPYA